MINDILLKRATALKLHGLINHWNEVQGGDWIETLINWEEQERAHRSLERRLSQSHLKSFKPLNEFDWGWPKECDRQAIEECMTLSFIQSATNLIFCGPNGVGKSTLVSNIAHQAIIQGHTALFVTAGEMLNNLASQDGDNALRRRIKYYVQPTVLIIDEVGYLSYSNRHADLLFEIISRRYQHKPTIVTTNKPFSEWNDIFPNASCVVSLIDRLIHQSEIINIIADSYRLKEANEAKQRREAKRANKNGKKST